MVIRRLILTILPRLNPHPPPAIPPTGTIPESFEKLAGLLVLGLANTGISGSIVKTLIPNYGFSSRVIPFFDILCLRFTPIGIGTLVLRHALTLLPDHFIPQAKFQYFCRAQNCTI